MKKMNTLRSTRCRAHGRASHVDSTFRSTKWMPQPPLACDEPITYESNPVKLVGAPVALHIGVVPLYLSSCHSTAAASSEQSTPLESMRESTANCVS